MFKDQQEMKRLKDLGTKFAKTYPALAPMLRGTVMDSDVERLLEGISFQAAMMRQKLDNDFPNIIQDLIRIIWPHYLRPIPAASTVAFTPVPVLAESVTIPAGTSVSSIKVDDTPCIFSTCFDVEVHPLSIKNALFKQSPGQLPQITLIMDLNTIKLKDWKIKSLRFFLSGEYAEASDLFYLLMKCLKGITIKPLDGGDCITLSGKYLKPAGFNDDVSLITFPTNSFPGYRIIQEYFFMPDKFLYVDLSGWEQWKQRGNGSKFELSFEFDSLPVRNLRVNKDSFTLYATPVINIFEHNAEPVFLDHRNSWYLIKPACTGSDDYEVFSIDSMKGKSWESVGERNYEPFEYFITDTNSSTYYTMYRQSPNKPEPDVYFAISYQDVESLFPSETISLTLKCTNGKTPENLRIGDICKRNGSIPQLVEFRNIKPVTPSIPPPVESDSLGKLISMLSLNYLSLCEKDNIRALLEFYIFPECRDLLTILANEKRVNGIEDIQDREIELLYKESILRGREITMKLCQDNYISKGDMYVFGSVLNSFFGGYSSINSFTKLVIKETQKGEIIECPTQMGKHYPA